MRVLFVLILFVSFVSDGLAQISQQPATCNFDLNEPADLDRKKLDDLMAGWVERLKRLTGSTKRIVGGRIACPNDWPYFVAFRQAQGNRHLYFCGGTMISEQWALTAAHCFADDKASVQVVIGTTDLVTEENASVYNAVEVRKHPNYEPYDPTSGASQVNDIALVRIDRRFRGPKAILSENIQSDGDLGQGRAFVAGFGTTDAITPTAQSRVNLFQRSFDGRGILSGSSRLLQTVVPLVSAGICQTQWRNLSPDRSICAGYELGMRDSCEGDSGGPLVALDRSSKPYQIGLVSYGSGCAQAASYGVYTRISAYRDWIRFHVRDAVFYDATPETDFALMTALHQMMAEKFSDVRERMEMRLTSGPEFSTDDLLTFEVVSKTPGRLLVLDIDPKGQITQLIPNQYMRETNNEIIVNQAFVVPTRRPSDGMPEFQMPASPDPAGEGRLIALVIPEMVLRETQFEVISPRGFQKKPDSNNYIQNLVNLIENQAIATDGSVLAGWAFHSVKYIVVE